MGGCERLGIHKSANFAPISPDFWPNFAPISPDLISQRNISPLFPLAVMGPFASPGGDNALISPGL